MGEGKEIPYNESFDNADKAELFTVIDDNGDDHSWSYSAENGLEQLDATNTCDDWLITPPVRLSKDSYYKVSFKSACNSNDTHRIGISTGKLPNVESLTQVIMEPINIATGFEKQSFTAKFRIADNDDYYLGFHATSNPASPLSLDDIVVEKLTVVDAPAAVSNITIVPAKKGVLSAKITFNAPIKQMPVRICKIFPK